MKQTRQINNSEKRILKSGKFVAVPINLQLLLTPAQLYVMNAIRHYNNIGNPRISVSLFMSTTGLSKQTVLNALSALTELGIIERVHYNTSGSVYRVIYKGWGEAVEALNKVPDAEVRKKLANTLKQNMLNNKII